MLGLLSRQERLRDAHGAAAAGAGPRGSPDLPWVQTTEFGEAEGSNWDIPAPACQEIITGLLSIPIGGVVLGVLHPLPAQSLLPPQVATVGSIIAGQLHMTIVCDAMGCHNRKTVDLVALRRELGENYRIADFVARSCCGKCGAKWPQFSVRVGPIQTGGMR